MKSLMTLLIFLTALTGKAIASGCDHTRYLQEEVAISLGKAHLYQEKLQVDGDRLYLIHEDLRVGFKFYKDGHLMTAAELQEAKMAIEQGAYQVVDLEKENVMFSYTSDCNGDEVESTGRYLLKAQIGDESYELVYPYLPDLLDRYPRSDKVLPVFTR